MLIQRCQQFCRSTRINIEGSKMKKFISFCILMSCLGCSSSPSTPPQTYYGSLAVQGNCVIQNFTVTATYPGGSITTAASGNYYYSFAFHKGDTASLTAQDKGSVCGSDAVTVTINGFKADTSYCMGFSCTTSISTTF
jgi:hypothetical protein